MNEKLIIRKMNESDLKDVHEIELLAHPAPWKFSLLVGEWKKEKYHYAFVAESQKINRIVGYCFCWGWGGVDMTLSNIAVHPRHRRVGIGAGLMETVVETARKIRCISIILEVRESNTAAQGLYKRFGFDVVGRRNNYYTSPQENGLLMRLPVNED